MKLLINLASEPFRNRRLFWLLIAMVIGVSSWVGLTTLDAKLQLENEVRVLEPRVKKLETESQRNTTVDFSGSTLTIGQNQALIVAQDLIARKGFSWSQLLNDLERFVPASIRVTRIAVDQVGKSKEKDATSKTVSLSFDVIGKGATEVTAMIQSLNTSGRFSVFPKSQKQIEGTDEYEFQLEVQYQPPQVAGSHSGASPTQVAAQGGKQ